ncbi:MAG: hypothetical protein WD512_12200 [Candidatus Paceibacterota bacterium]
MEKLANVNAQYMSMHHQLFYDGYPYLAQMHLLDNNGLVDNSSVLFVKDSYDPFPSFFNYRNMKIIFDNKIYGIRPNYSRLYKIYNYLRSYLPPIGLSPVIHRTYHVGVLPLRYWYSSGKNYSKGYK